MHVASVWQREVGEENEVEKISEVIIERALNSENNLFPLCGIGTYFILFIFPRLIRI